MASHRPRGGGRRGHHRTSCRLTLRSCASTGRAIASTSRLLARACGALRGRRDPAIRPAEPRISGIPRTSCGSSQPTQHEQNVLSTAALPAIEFLGLFDTVGSLGACRCGRTGRFNWLSFLAARSHRPSPICVHVCHAMAMDERRAQFFPSPFDPGRCPDGDVGRSLVFPATIATLVAATPIPGCRISPSNGCCRRARRPGLRAEIAACAEAQPWPAVDELQRQPAWRLLGSWPRWHPVVEVLHPSVATRAAAVAGLDVTT